MKRWQRITVCVVAGFFALGIIGNLVGPTPAQRTATATAKQATTLAQASTATPARTSASATTAGIVAASPAGTSVGVASGGGADTATTTATVSAPATTTPEAPTSAPTAPPVATPAATATVRSAATPTAKPTATVKPTATPDTRQADLEQYMLENFGGAGRPEFAATWYGNITGYRIVNNQVEVSTNLFHKDENKAMADNIRSAVISWARDAKRNTGITAVAVHASDGFVLSRFAWS